MSAPSDAPMTPLIVRVRLLNARHHELRAIITEAQTDRPADMVAFVAACDQERREIIEGIEAIEAEQAAEIEAAERLAGLRPRS